MVANFPPIQVASAQAPARLGILVLGSPERNPYNNAFVDGLRERGYVEGKNLDVEIVGAAGHYDRLPGLASRLIEHKARLIVVGSPTAARAVQGVSSEIAVVCYSCGDPVENGLSHSLSRPGTNVTGMASLSAELVNKRLELVRELLPKSSRVATLIFPTNPGTPPTLKAFDEASRKLHLRIIRLEIRTLEDFPKAFERAAGSADALVVQDDPILLPARATIATLGIKHRLPVLVGITDNVDAGALIGYSPERIGMARRAAYHADRILKGTSAADLAWEQASQFELVVNNKTARAIGLVIPRSLLSRADRVIE